jgi:hypothetical protein
MMSNVESHNDSDHSMAWKVVSMGAGVGAGFVTRRIVQALWGRFGDDSGGAPPTPTDRRVPWVQAVQWTVVTSVAVGVARLVSQRVAAAGWQAATGEPPPTADAG